MEPTIQDEMRLNLARAQRLKELLPVLENVAVMLAYGDSPELKIGCTEAAEVDAILAESFDLMQLAYSVCGFLQTSLYFAGDRIWEGCYPEFLDQAVQSVLFGLEEEPMPATLDKPKSATPTAALPQPLPAQSVATIAADLNQEPARIEQYAIATGAQIFLYEGKTLIPGSAAEAIYRNLWQESLDALLERRGLVSTNGSAPTTEKKTAATPKKAGANTATKPAARKTPAKKRTAAKQRSARKTEG